MVIRPLQSKPTSQNHLRIPFNIRHTTIIEVPPLVVHHQPKQITSLDVSTKAWSSDANVPESSFPRTMASRTSTSKTSGVKITYTFICSTWPPCFTAESASKWLKSTTPTGPR